MLFPSSPHVLIFVVICSHLLHSCFFLFLIIVSAPYWPSPAPAPKGTGCSWGYLAQWGLLKWVGRCGGLRTSTLPSAHKETSCTETKFWGELSHQNYYFYNTRTILQVKLYSQPIKKRPYQWKHFTILSHTYNTDRNEHFQR